MRTMLVNVQKKQKQQKKIVQTYSLVDDEGGGMGVSLVATLCGENHVESIPPSSDYLMDKT